MSEIVKYGDIRLNFLPKSGYLKKFGGEFAKVISGGPIVPTHWGDDPPKEKFDPEGFLENLEKNTHSFRCFARRNTPKWEGFYSDQMIQLNFKKPAIKWWPRIFQWSDQIAEVCQPEFGVCHPVLHFEKCVHNNWSAILNYDDLFEYGPTWFGAKTYLGKRLVKAIGQDELRRSGIFQVTNTEWGVKIDLINECWNVRPSDFVERQSTIMAALCETGIIGRYGPTSLDIVAGANWKKAKIRFEKC